MNKWIAAATAGAMCAGAALFSSPVASATGDHHRLVFSQPLPNVPGESLTAIVVSYDPGGKSDSHHHSGSVFAYVLSGAIRSQNSATGPVRVYRAGEAFFEPPGSTHLINENASTTEPASLLAVFVADTGAMLTMPGASTHACLGSIGPVFC